MSDNSNGRVKRQMPHYDLVGNFGGLYGSYSGHHAGCCDDLLEYLAVGIALFALMMNSMSRRRRKKREIHEEDTTEDLIDRFIQFIYGYGKKKATFISKAVKNVFNTLD